MIDNGQAIVIDPAAGHDKLFAPTQMDFLSSIEGLMQILGLLEADSDRGQALVAAGPERSTALFIERAR